MRYLEGRGGCVNLSNLFFGNGLSGSILFVMGDGDVDSLEFKVVKQFLPLSIKVENGLPRPLVAYLNIFPRDSPSHARAEAFQDRFLYGEAGGEMLIRIGLRAAVIDFPLSKHFLFEPFRIFLYRMFDSFDFDDVDSDSKDHHLPCKRKVFSGR